ncbi:MAG: NrfD/PsrC family molybdoenzyme membrane anchor subunit [Bacillota bacterium]
MNLIVVTAAAILTAAGLIAYLVQLRSGLTATGLHDRFTWGLYIQGFFFFSALAAGMLVFIALVTLFSASRFWPLARMSSAVSFSCLIAAGIMLWADLGKPFRVFRILFSNNFSSPMTWDFYTLLLCVLLNLVYLSGVVGTGLRAAAWSVICLAAALVFIMVHTLFFLSREGAGFRSQPFLALDTLVQSLWGGLAAVNLVAAVSGLAEKSLLAALLVFTVAAPMPLIGSSIAAATGAKDKTHQNQSKKFILLHLFILAVLLAVVAERKIDLAGSAAAAVAVLVLLAVFLEKAHLVGRYQHNPTLPLPFSLFEEAPAYRPTYVEWMVAVGSGGLCLLLSVVIIGILEHVR